MKFVIGFSSSVALDINRINQELQLAAPATAIRTSNTAFPSSMTCFLDPDDNYDLGTAINVLSTIAQLTQQEALYVRGFEHHISEFYDKRLEFINDWSPIFCGFPIIFRVQPIFKIQLLWSFIEDCVRSNEVELNSCDSERSSGFQSFMDRICYLSGMTGAYCPVEVSVDQKPAGKVLRLVK